MKIHDCIKKAGKAFDKDDRATLLAKLPQHVTALGEVDGAVAAIDEFTMELQLERSELVLRIEDEGGEVPETEAEIEEKEVARETAEYEAQVAQKEKDLKEWAESIPVNAENEINLVVPNETKGKQPYQWNSRNDAMSYAKAYGFDKAEVVEYSPTKDGKFEIHYKTNRKNKRFLKVRRGHGFITLAERDRIWQDWDEQIKNSPRIGGGKMILSLFDRTGTWSQPYVDAGYDVVQVDVDHPLWAMDILDVNADTLIEYGWENVQGILAAPPCNHFSNACRGLWKIKDKDGRTRQGLELLDHLGAMVQWLQPDFYAIENPSQSRINRPADFTKDENLDLSTVEWLGEHELQFNPNKYGDDYTKSTKLWGEFNSDLPTANVFPAQGSRIWKLTGYTKKQKQERSITPVGFSDAFFMANSPLSAAHVNMEDWLSEIPYFDNLMDYFGNWAFTTLFARDQVKRGRTLEQLSKIEELDLNTLEEANVPPTKDDLDRVNELVQAKLDAIEPPKNERVGKYDEEKKFEIGQTWGGGAKLIIDVGTRMHKKKMQKAMLAKYPPSHHTNDNGQGPYMVVWEKSMATHMHQTREGAIAEFNELHPKEAPQLIPETVEEAPTLEMTGEETPLQKRQREKRERDAKREEVPVEAGAGDLFAGQQSPDLFPGTTLEGERTTPEKELADLKTEYDRITIMRGLPFAEQRKAAEKEGYTDYKMWRSISLEDQKQRRKRIIALENPPERLKLDEPEKTPEGFEKAVYELTQEDKDSIIRHNNKQLDDFVKNFGQEEADRKVQGIVAGILGGPGFNTANKTSESAVKAIFRKEVVDAWRAGTPMQTQEEGLQDEVEKDYERRESETPPGLREFERKKLQKTAQQILHLNNGNPDLSGLSGPALVTLRQDIMQLLTGAKKRPPKAKSGITILNKTAMEKFGIPKRGRGTSIREAEEMLSNAIMNYAKWGEATPPETEIKEPSSGKLDQDLTEDELLAEYDEKPHPEREAQELHVGDEVAVLGDIGVIVGISGDNVQFRAHRNTNPKAYNNVPKSMVTWIATPDNSKASFSKAVDNFEPEEIEVGMDKGRMMQLLGEKMYTYSLGEVVIKELIQNSFDAGKAAILEGLVEEASIDVSIDYPNRTIIIKDNAKGMSAEILKKAFFTIGGTDKSDLPIEDRSGGLGLAKVGFMLNSDGLWVRTTQKGSKRAITVEMTPRDIQLQRVKPSYEDADIDEHGTEVRVKIPESRENEDGQEKSYGMPWKLDGVHFFDKPLIHPGVVITAKATGFRGDIEEAETVTLPMGKNFDDTNTPKLTDITFPDWGTAEVYFGTVRDKEAQTHVLSAGVYQFSYASELRMGESIPYDIIIDVRSKVKAEHSYYPFTNSRESWSPNVEEDIKLLQRYLAQTALGGEAKILQENMNNIVSMPIVTNEDADKAITKRKTAREFKQQTEVPELTPEEIAANEKWHKEWMEQREAQREMTLDEEGNLVDKEGNEVVENEEKYERRKQQEKEKKKEGRMEADVDAPEFGEFMEEMKQDPKLPIFHSNVNIDVIEIGRKHGSPEQLFAEIGTLFIEMKDHIADSGIWTMDGMKSENLFFAGVSIDKGYGGLHIKLPYKAVFLNPLYAQWNDKTLFGTRASMVSTMIHELAHQADMGHNQSHNTAMTKIMIHLEDNGMMDYFRDSLLKTLDRHSATYKAMREEYDKSSTKNVGKSFKDYEESSESASDGGTGSDTQDTSGPVQAGKQQSDEQAVRQPVRDSGSDRQPQGVFEESRTALSDEQVEKVAEVVNLTDRRTEKDLREFRTGFMQKIAEGVATKKEAIRLADEAGVFEGYEIGDRLVGKTGALTITGFDLWKYGKLAQGYFDSTNIKPTIVNVDGVPHIPMIHYSKPDGEQSRLYLDGVRANMDLYKGPEASFSLAKERTDGITIDDAKEAVSHALGRKLTARIEFYETMEDIPENAIKTGRRLITKAGLVEGFVVGKKAYLITKNISSKERAVWVAWHEMWHRGAKVRYGAQFNRALRKAGTNNVVRRIADAIARERGNTLSKMEVIEEALAELNAAMRMNNYEHIKQQYKVTVPAGMRSGWRSMVQGWIEAIKHILRRTKAYMLDRPIDASVDMTDLQISNMIRGVKLNVEADVTSPAFSIVPEDAKFTRPEVEDRWVAAGKGYTPVTMKEWVSDHVNEVKEGFARHYINLPNTPQFAEVAEQLRKVEAAPEASRDATIRMMKLVTGNMTSEDLELFTRKVVLDDLTYEITQEHDLPMDLTPEEVHETLARIDQLLENRPDIMEAVEARRVLVQTIAQKMVDAGVLTENEIKNPYYYRHQVLDYMHAKSRYGMQRNSVRTPKRASRKGSLKDINVNYLEVEFEWLNKALVDIEVATTLEWVKSSVHNARSEAIEAGRVANAELLQSTLDADLDNYGYEVMSQDGERVLRITSPLNEELLTFNRRIAMGMRDIAKSLQDGSFDIPERYDEIASEIANDERGRNPLFFEFLGWLADNNSGGARMVFTAINQRKVWKRELLGDRYVNTQSMDELVRKGFAPEGYVTWQPDKGRLLYTAHTLTDHVVSKMVEKMSEDAAGLSAADAEMMLANVRTIMAVGGPKFQMIIPAELAETLDSLHDEDMSSKVGMAFRAGLTQWKRWQLVSPWRFLKYNANNFSGDIDAVIAIGPKVLKKFPQAVSELTAVMFRGATPSALYNEAVRRGVFASGLSMQEIKQIDEMAEFRNILQKEKIDFSLSGAKELVKRLKNFPLGTFRTMQKLTWWRENMMRYAAYLHYEELLRDGYNLGPMEYGASRPEILETLTSHKDKAAMLARKTVGDYGDISHFGKTMREKAYPFWSWVEVNTKRYWRLGINAGKHNLAAGIMSGTLSGAAIGIRGATWIGMRTMALYATLYMYNNLRYGDEEDDLSPEQRARLHINIGRMEDGSVGTIRFQGALSDFLDWVGFADVSDTIMEVESGRATYKDVIDAAWKAPVNKFVGGVTPVVKVPVELVRGESWWPDVFHPRRIRDRWRYVAQVWALEHEYDAIFDKPSKGYWESWKTVGHTETMPGQSAYHEIQSAGYEWRERNTGKSGSSSFTTPRSEALYNYKLARKFKDKDAEKAAKERIIELSKNRGEAMKAIQNYKRKSRPLAFLNKTERAKFKRTLTPEEIKKLKKAERWHKETF